MSLWEDAQTEFPFQDRIQDKEKAQLPILTADHFVALASEKRYLFALVNQDVIWTDTNNFQWTFYEDHNPPVKNEDFAHLFPSHKLLTGINSFSGTALYKGRQVQ